MVSCFSVKLVKKWSPACCKILCWFLFISWKPILSVDVVSNSPFPKHDPIIITWKSVYLSSLAILQQTDINKYMLVRFPFMYVRIKSHIIWEADWSYNCVLRQQGNNYINCFVASGASNDNVLKIYQHQYVIRILLHYRTFGIYGRY